MNKELTIMDCVEAFAVPGQNNIIDMIRPDTGRSWHYNETLEEMRKRYPNAEKVNYKEFRAEIVKRENPPITWNEVTQERYDYGLEVLPPIAFDGNSFLVGEASDHHSESGAARYQAFFGFNGKYYASARGMTRAEFLLFRSNRLPLVINEDVKPA